MEKFKTSLENGKKVHYSVGIIIKKGKKYLLIDRKLPPYGYAGIAGHINKNETPEEALKREVKEECGCSLRSFKKILEEKIKGESCIKGTKIHYWYLFKGILRNEKVILDSEEAKSIGWYLPSEIKKLRLEKVWKYWFKKLKII